MMNVLIPTDFTVQSLDMVKSAAKQFPGKKLNIILFHALYMPADIQDLLFLPKGVPAEKITEEFRNACAAIKRKNSPSISQICFRHMYGSTGSVFKNFIEANRVDCIYMPEHATLTQAYPNSVAPQSLFKGAPVPVVTATTAPEQVHRISKEQFADGALAVS